MSKKILYALLATVFAVGIWLYVITTVNPEWEETYYNISVALENEEILLDRGYMLVQDEDPKVTLRLSGNRTDLMKLNSGNITLIADLSKIYSAGEQTIGYTIIYPGHVPSNAFEIVSQSPNQITLSVSRRKSKEVEVQVNFGESAVPEDYIAFKENATLDHEKITVAGPAAVIDKIASAKISVDLNDQRDTISQKFAYTFCDAEGEPIEAAELKYVKASVEEIQYTLKIQRWKDIKLDVNVIDGGGLKKENCSINLSLGEIRVAGNSQTLQTLNTLILADINLSEITDDVTKTFDIILPEGVTNLSGQSTVTVTVEIPELAMKQFTVTDIQATNVPKGLKADIIAKEKVVTVRGPADQLAKLSENDLRILVDFTNAEAGTASYKATVIILDEQLKNTLGIMFGYDIPATVQKIG